MPLFEVAIIEKPTKKDAEEGRGESLAFGPKAVIARDAQSAAILAVLSDNADIASLSHDRMEVLVRPFA